MGVPLETIIRYCGLLNQEVSESNATIAED